MSIYDMLSDFIKTANSCLRFSLKSTLHVQSVGFSATEKGGQWTSVEGPNERLVSAVSLTVITGEHRVLRGSAANRC